MYGKHHKEATIEVISKKLSGENHPNWGKHLPEDTKLKISIANKENPNKSMLGKHHKEDTKQKMSQTSSIAVINLDTKEIFNSAKEASEKYNIPRSSICYCCKGTYKHAGGYSWAYYDLDTNMPITDINIISQSMQSIKK